MYDGGPAFPFMRSEAGGGGDGMSLRDWFAGMALWSLLATETAQAQLELAVREAATGRRSRKSAAEVP